MTDQELGDILTWGKKHWTLLLLLAMLSFGLYLRVYHIDYPVIGYHNWKETHYLTEARNFAREGFFYEGIFIPHWEYPGMHDAQSGAHGDTFPTMGIIVGLLFKMFGESLMLARLTSVLSILGSIVFMYLIVKHLFKREDLALTAAFLMTINPLLVFYGRQADLINHSLFFLLMGVYYYLVWIDHPAWKNLLLFSVAIAIGVATKYPNALLGIPMAAIFPWKRLTEKKYWKQFIVFALIFGLVPLWAWYSSHVAVALSGYDVGKEETVVDLHLIFDGDFWTTMKSYFSDNYTLLGLATAGIGALLFLLFFKKTASYRFFLAYLIGGIVWFVTLSYKLQGHSYHQYPLVPLVVFFIAFCFIVIADNIYRFISWKYTKLVVLVLLIAMLYPSSMQAKNRQFDTQFIGLDIAGDYIREHSAPDETFIHSSHQSFGSVWHADRIGYKPPKNVSELQFAEDNLKLKFLFIYQWGFQIKNNQELWHHITQHYSRKQAAFVPIKGGVQPWYYLMERGGTFNESAINERLKNMQPQIATYDFTFGKQQMYYVNFD